MASMIDTDREASPLLISLPSASATSSSAMFARVNLASAWPDAAVRRGLPRLSSQFPLSCELCPTGPTSRPTTPLYADDRNFYKVELWTMDEQRVLRMLYAGNNPTRRAPSSPITSGYDRAAE